MGEWHRYLHVSSACAPPLSQSAPDVVHDCGRQALHALISTSPENHHWRRSAMNTSSGATPRSDHRIPQVAAIDPSPGTWFWLHFEEEYRLARTVHGAALRLGRVGNRACRILQIPSPYGKKFSSGTFSREPPESDTRTRIHTRTGDWDRSFLLSFPLRVQCTACDPLSLSSSSMATDIIAGSAGGIAQVLAGHPLDTVKVITPRASATIETSAHSVVRLVCWSIRRAGAAADAVLSEPQVLGHD